MMEGELEVALAKIDINRHEAIDMLGSLGKLTFRYYVDGVIHYSVGIVDCCLYLLLLSHVRS